jgi:Ca2+-binding EF-hand superfamily protein
MAAPASTPAAANEALAGILKIGPDANATAEALARMLMSQLDSDGDGKLSAAEISAAVSRDGRSLSAAELQEQMVRLDADGDGKVSVAELSAALQQALGTPAEGEHHHHHKHGAKIGVMH